jgi:TPR repeat protein
MIPFEKSPFPPFNGPSRQLIVDGLRLAAEKGDARAQYFLGRYYDEESNDKEAYNWYFKAASQGYAEAQYCLGVSYESGLVGVDADIERKSWLIKSAKQGYVNAQLHLAFSYNEGVGVTKDDVEAYAYILLGGTHSDSDEGVQFLRANLEKTLSVHDLSRAQVRAKELQAAINAKSEVSWFSASLKKWFGK